MRRLLPLVLLSVIALAPLAGCDSGFNANSFVTVAYEGRLEDGTVFDSSDNATFRIGDTIRGFRDNVLDMEIGETRTFTVAPEDGYGSTPRPGIPPNSTLIFEVTLLDIR